ncbi:RNA polymerase sigma factor%2C sigma-70 family [[Eubacterium] contortum]|uniref:RNA polymerase sigma factor, sigma-70 family n=1 Tax=Faecalicatena contorta TaxID=39482 RepID=A0A174L840_9FIRM|nr:hypothetical protein [Faecalicatena contorta]CUP20422.1 RNA polymerase sigma factor%2C sigma-70 family [[Eubacterium] contortum] [Faecalicatena contorta]
MDKVKLKKYRWNKERIKRIDDHIDILCGKDIDVIHGKVTGSSHNFPYTEVRTTVEMYDPIENDKVNDEIREKQAEKIKLQKECEEVEEYISSIPDRGIKEIFELSFLNGKKQWEVAKAVGYSRGRISQIISGYLKN